MPTLNISGSLKDSEGNGIADKTIKIYKKLSSETSYPTTPDLELTTGTDGSFSGSLSVDPGKYDVKAVFEGDNTYLPSEAEKTNIDARESTTLTLNVSVS